MKLTKMRTQLSEARDIQERNEELNCHWEQKVQTIYYGCL